MVHAIQNEIDDLICMQIRTFGREAALSVPELQDGLYSRLDLRFSKAIYMEKRKLTFDTEVGNLFNRSNRGCQVHSIIQLIPSCDSEFPILPSAGLTIEF